MLSFAIRRLLQFIPTILGITLIMFLLLNLIPGNAALSSAGKLELGADVIEKLKADLQLDKPAYVRYFNYVGRLAQGDMGQSYLRRYDVADVVFDRLGATLKLAFSAIGIAIVLGVPLGFIAALKQGTWPDTLSTVVAVVSVSIPQFWLGILLMYVFSYMMHLLPTSGYGDGASANLVMPAMTLGLGYTALLARITRAAVVEVLSADYIRTARAKGLSEFRISYRHVFRNAFVLILTTAGLLFGSLIGQTVVVERVFSWPGIGSLLVESIFQRDIPVAQGCLLVIVIVFLIVNLLVDILYSVINSQIDFK
ncbi:ABC-type dipeptide/oligopeptide/nickel transport system permease component [Mesorhizobium soli]|uniref:ABC transporter permease n=1 Tax=Pseudaminobacter soli (ex Li et al. 2025) TaxID=1295366 RepID=UPI0024744D55|nr:ABC transporter permease [Mesorhizobium soli]MDH6234624.1 ABC-type dipeptide/oligopeptide/nickel transport system permease component [Mesorhizobium soli]